MRPSRTLVMVALVACWLGGHALLVAGAGQAPVADERPFRLAPPERYVTDVAVSEDVQSIVQKSLASTFLEGIRSLDWERAARGLTADFRGRFPRPEQGRPVEDPLLSIRRYEAGGLEVLSRDSFLKTIRGHVGSWTSVERASWHAFEFLLEPDGKRAFAKVHLELGGPGSGGERSVVNATMAVQAVEVGSNQWEIRRLELLDGTRVENPLPPFRDITDAVGLHFNRSQSNREVRQEILDTRASLIDSGLSVVDLNRDGFWDILATESMDHSVLFLNDGKGGFVRGPWNVADRRLIPSQYLVVDLDNDGLEELVSNRVVYGGDRAWMKIETRRAGEWVVLPRALEFDNPPGVEHTDALSITAGDVDGDGRLDLFVGSYETNRSRDPARFNRVDAHDGADNLLFINRGNLRFTEESDQRGITGTQYTYVSQFFDFDADGDLDLFEGNDYGRSVVWENRGDGTFRASTGLAIGREPNYTMGVTFGDWENTGDWSVYISNMYSHAGNRVVRLTESLSDPARAQVRLLATGNQLFTRDAATGRWQERGVSLGVNDGGWAWGTVFFDLDNDGDREIFVANGNTSYRDPAAPDY